MTTSLESGQLRDAQSVDSSAWLSPTEADNTTPQIRVHSVADDWVAVRSSPASSIAETWQHDFDTTSEPRFNVLISTHSDHIGPISAPGQGNIDIIEQSVQNPRRDSVQAPQISGEDGFRRTSPQHLRTLLSVEHDVAGIDDRHILQRRRSFRVEETQPSLDHESSSSEAASSEDDIDLSDQDESYVFPHPNARAQERQYTQSLGSELLWNLKSSPVPSDVVTDAGEQLELVLRQKQAQEVPNIAQSVELFSPEDDLQSRLYGEFVQSRNKQAVFFPRKRLCDLINPESVAQELRRNCPRNLREEQIEEIAKKICDETIVFQRGKGKIKSFRKIFALLVLAETTSLILQLLHHEVSDLDLPLTFIENKGAIGFRRRDQSSTTPLKCSRTNWDNLKNYQWKLVAPYFSRDQYGGVKHYKLDDYHILPFVVLESREDETDNLGGYGRVFMAQIHPHHHNFFYDGRPDRGFAIKEQLHEDYRDIFKKEVMILKHFSGTRSHPHIISLLASYEQFNKFHLIFHRADADLEAYWKKLYITPTLNAHNITWMINQFRGLTDGLLRLHKLLTFSKLLSSEKGTASGFIPERVEHMKSSITNLKHIAFENNEADRVRTESFERPASPIQSTGQAQRMTEPPVPSSAVRAEQYHEMHLKIYGRHGDIHPKNILWFGNEPIDAEHLSGTLKLADFGAAEINSSVSRSEPRDVPNHPSHRPPEWDLDSPIRQSYDIWCLGCVFLEFVAWMLGGEELKHDFTIRRFGYDVTHGYKSDSFFEIKSDDSHRLEVMIKQAVLDFIDDLHRHPSCTDCLHDLLNFIQHGMLVVDSRQRKSCDQTWTFLENMYQDCRVNEDYAAATSPWCIKNPPWSYRMYIDQLDASKDAIQRLTTALNQSRLREKMSP